MFYILYIYNVYYIYLYDTYKIYYSILTSTKSISKNTMIVTCHVCPQIAHCLHGRKLGNIYLNEVGFQMT